MVLQENGLSALVRCAFGNFRTEITGHIIWTITNICRGKPPPAFHIIRESLPALLKGFEFRSEKLSKDIF